MSGHTSICRTRRSETAAKASFFDVVIGRINWGGCVNAPCSCGTQQQSISSNDIRALISAAKILSQAAAEQLIRSMWLGPDLDMGVDCSTCRLRSTNMSCKLVARTLNSPSQHPTFDVGLLPSEPHSRHSEQIISYRRRCSTGPI